MNVKIISTDLEKIKKFIKSMEFLSKSTFNNSRIIIGNYSILFRNNYDNNGNIGMVICDVKFNDASNFLYPKNDNILKQFEWSNTFNLCIVKYEENFLIKIVKSLIKISKLKVFA